MDTVDNNIKTLPKLLRVIANSEEAKKHRHDLIFNNAADLIEYLAKFREQAKKLVRNGNWE